MRRINVVIAIFAGYQCSVFSLRIGLPERMPLPQSRKLLK